MRLAMSVPLTVIPDAMDPDAEDIALQADMVGQAMIEVGAPGARPRLYGTRAGTGGRPTR